MRLRGYWAFAAIWIAAILCVASPVAMAGAATFQAPAGFVLKKDGTLVHKASGTQFPLVYAGFGRTTNVAFDPGGKNVAIVYSYSRGTQVVEARVALVHVVMMSAHEHFAALAPIVGSYFSDLSFSRIARVSEGPLLLPGVKPGGAWQGRFRAMRKRQAYQLSLTTVDFGYWSARVTAAYPQAQAAEAQDRITKLIDQIRRTGPRH